MTEENSDWDHNVRNISIMSGTSTRHPSERIPVVIPVRPIVWNGALKLLVWLPLAWLVFNIAIGLTSGLWWSVLITTALMASAGSVVLARNDQRLLRVVGNDVDASAWLAIIPSLYLAKRAKAMWESNAAAYCPLWIHLALLIGTLVTCFVVPIMLGIIALLAEAQEAIG